MTEKTRIRTYAEFYPFYLGEHLNPTCRKLHFIGTTGVFLILGWVVATGDLSRLWYAPLCGYAFAWVGHFAFEKNRPATFQYPLWSLISDFKMYFELLSGKRKFDERLRTS